MHLTFQGAHPADLLSDVLGVHIMADKKHIVPETLAILPVRDTVLFPGAVLPLTVGRESSLALVNSLTGDEKLLGSGRSARSAH